MASTNSDDFCVPGEHYFRFNLIFLSLVGLWRNEQWPKKYLKLYDFYEYTMHTLPLIYIVVTMIGTYQHRNELTEFLANLDKNVVAINFIFKYFIFVMRRRELKILITEITYSGDKITKKCVKQMSVYVVVVTVLTTAVVSAFSVSALLKGEMIVEAWLPFNTLKSMNNLILASQLLASAFTPCILRGNAMQGLVCSMIMYLCEQLKEIKSRIRSIKYSLENEVCVKEQLKNIVIKHVRLIR